MRILLDNNVPALAARHLPEHEVFTAAKCGWAALSNGMLVAAAEENGFDVLLTLDKGFEYQQNLAGRRISLVILIPVSQRRADLMGLISRVLPQLDSLVAGQVVVLRRTEE